MYSLLSRHFAHLGEEESWKNRCHGVTVPAYKMSLSSIVLLIDQYLDFLERSLPHLSDPVSASALYLVTE